MGEGTGEDTGEEGGSMVGIGLVEPTSGWWVSFSSDFWRRRRSRVRHRDRDSQRSAAGGPGRRRKCAFCAAFSDAHWRSRPAATDHRGVMAETLSKLCGQGLVAEAVEALELVVHTDTPAVSKSLCYTVLKGCVAKKDLVLGRRVHAFTVRMGYESNTFLANHILRMYASHGRLQEAMDVFEGVAKPDAFTWSAIISAHVKLGRDAQAIQLYHRMRRSGTGVKPDGHVFVAALQACARAADLEAGQQVHAHVLATGLQPDLFVCNCLVDMYAKCGSLQDAHRVFAGLGHKDVVTWNAMLAGYSQQGRGQEALRLYLAMQADGTVASDSVTFVCLLQACASVGAPALETGKHFHVLLTEQGHQADVFVANSPVNMYAKCGSLVDAQRVFDELGCKNVVMWTAMIAGYSQQGMGHQALRLYSAMQEEGIAVPDSVTFACLLQACASVGTPALDKGKELHAHIREQGHEADVFVASSLVNMYAKCGNLEDANRVFDGLGLGHKNVVTWTAMIAGYSQQGMGQEALRLYSAMQQEGIAVPDSVTFVSLLQACADVAALHLGRQLHVQIVEQELQADSFVAGSLIHMYCKCGSMVDAQQVFDALCQPNVVVWSALIAGYSSQGQSDVVFHLVRRMREDGIQPNSITFLSVLTVCSHAGLVKEGWDYFEAMSSDHGITPTQDHNTCMVDLLGRAGQLDEALALVRSMPTLPNAAVWHTLLAACRKWSNVEVGRHAFQEAVKLAQADAAAYVLMFNIYTGAQMWEEAHQLDAMRKRMQAWKQPGQSWWTDTHGLVHSFFVDEKHPQLLRFQMVAMPFPKQGLHNIIITAEEVVVVALAGLLVTNAIVRPRVAPLPAVPGTERCGTDEEPANAKRASWCFTREEEVRLSAVFESCSWVQRRGESGILSCTLASPAPSLEDCQLRMPLIQKQLAAGNCMQ